MKLFQFPLFALLLFYKPAANTADNYYFDHKLVYQRSYSDSPVSSITDNYYINSRDNSYVGRLWPINDTAVEYLFIDQNGRTARLIFQQAQVPLIDAAGITVKAYREYKNSYKSLADHYDFFRLSDTVINEKMHSRFWIRCTNPKMQKRKKTWSMVFMVDESVPFKPLLTHATNYEVWKSRHNIPDGLVTQIDNYNASGRLEYSEKLVRMDSLNIWMRRER